MSGLTTHVLDTMHGRPAANMAVRLMQGGTLVSVCVTGADGRCAELLIDRALEVGCYRLEFGVAAYFRQQGVELADPPFLDIVGIDFGVADPAAHHHVPLLVSPYAYSTYRGS